MLLAQLAPAVTGVRLSPHVLGAAIWIGGQITLAGLVPTLRHLGPDAPRRVARAFSRLSWPAYALLLGTGVWNVLAVAPGQSQRWDIVLGAKIAVAVLAGVSAWLHGRARSVAGLAVWGAATSMASLSALVLGVVLAG